MTEKILFVRSGSIRLASSKPLSGAGQNGYYWSPNWPDGHKEYIYGLNFGSNSVNPSSGGYSNFNIYPLRCLAS